MSTITETIHLTAFDLTLSGVLILIAGAISIALRLGLEKRLFIAAIRAVIQLLLVGYILRIVFRIDNPLPLLLVLIIMILVASFAAVGRSSRTIKGVVGFAFFTLVLTGLVTTFSATTLIINVEPWYQPRYVIPLLGMVLGNTLTGISLSLDRLLEELAVKRNEIEMELALGATRWEAANRPLGSAVRRGMIPMINSMMVVGLVSLPGMMTGQILAGADPLDAVKYQIIILFMITAATALGCIMTALLVYRRLFNDRHQLRVELIINEK